MIYTTHVIASMHEVANSGKSENATVNKQPYAHPNLSLRGGYNLANPHKSENTQLSRQSTGLTINRLPRLKKPRNNECSGIFVNTPLSNDNYEHHSQKKISPSVEK
tara:strand:+ start:1527 stop:1844 length:318 start_codon:yes stop_codon:yes gene_type:complete